MKTLSVLAMFLVFGFQLSAQTLAYQSLPVPAVKPGLDILLHYTSPSDEVIVKDGKLTHIATTYHYDESRPYVATPAGVSQQAILESVPLNGHQLNALKDMINNSDFLYLPGSTYGAPEGQRSYDYNLHIKADGREKAVAYRSNPSYGNAPAPFERMQEYIWKLVTEVER
ncbi:MAG: hypothetical protein KDC66_11015 [Phaeodactylibacter sp.]|nr:hypothetical protein [Phaeodactylibacter sp.]MCB9276654.1 hypothetical protein [Lewinellaceae bacterium]